MKRKLSFLIMLAILALISISVASASENTTEIESATDDAILTISDVKDSPKGPDLKVDGDMDSQKSSLTVKITVKNNGDTAYKSTLKADLPNDLNCLNIKVSQGSFDEKTGIWHIGTLSKNQKETLKIIAAPVPDRYYTMNFKASSSSKDIYGYDNSLSIDINVKEPARDSSGGSTSYYDYSFDSDPSNFRNSEQRSLYFIYTYSDYRQITKTIDHTAEAKSDENTTVNMSEKPTANPIALALLSLATLIATGSKRRI